MANQKHVEILKLGVEDWNKNMQYKYDGRPFGKEYGDLQNLDFSFLKEFNFSRFVENYIPHPGEINELFAEYNEGKFTDELIKSGWKNLNNIDLVFADLSGANLSGISLKNADLRMVNLTNADLSEADLSGVNLTHANLTGANLNASILNGANLTNANFTDADLNSAYLENTILVETILENSNLTNCHVYGLSAWKLNAKGSIQANLVITPYNEQVITVDNLEIAQFLYLMLNNENLRNVIDTITSKVVLILGRFTEERKAILDAIRADLRTKNYLPILFDFEKPNSRDLTETISTLANISRFIIADLTDAKSIPQELQMIIPDLPNVPVQPILLKSESEYAMFEHFRHYPWVLKTYVYKNQAQLIGSISEKVIKPAELKLQKIMKRKNQGKKSG